MWGLASEVVSHVCCARVDKGEFHWKHNFIKQFLLHNLRPGHLTYVHCDPSTARMYPATGMVTTKSPHPVRLVRHDTDLMEPKVVMSRASAASGCTDEPGHYGAVESGNGRPSNPCDSDKKSPYDCTEMKVLLLLDSLNCILNFPCILSRALLHN